MNWANIDQTRYEPGTAHEEVSCLLKDDKDSLLVFSGNQLQDCKPRDDYREFIYSLDNSSCRPGTPSTVSNLQERLLYYQLVASLFIDH